jgi:hypothetical protein
MGLFSFLWRQLPDKCQAKHCTRRGVRGNENKIDGKILCDECFAIHLLRRGAALEFDETMTIIEEIIRE